MVTVLEISITNMIKKYWMLNIFLCVGMSQRTHCVIAGAVDSGHVTKSRGIQEVERCFPLQRLSVHCDAEPHNVSIWFTRDPKNRKYENDYPPGEVTEVISSLLFSRVTVQTSPWHHRGALRSFLQVGWKQRPLLLPFNSGYRCLLKWDYISHVCCYLLSK